jgi:outer membrane protein assembly factor BamB
MRLILTCAAVWALAAAAGAMAAEPAGGRLEGPEWPMYRGNPGFTGVSPDDSVRPPLKLVWSYRTDGDTSGDAGAGVTVGGGKVFVTMDNTRAILALDAADGRLLWEHSDPNIGMRAPTYSNGRVYLWKQRWRKVEIAALDAGTGEPAWNCPLQAHGGGRKRHPLPVHNGRIYCDEGGPAPAVVAIDAKDGKVVWRSPLGAEDGAATVGVSVAGGMVFAATRVNFDPTKETRGATIALNADDGKILWRRKGVFPFWVMATDGKVAVCPMQYTPDRKMYLLDAKTGETLWSAPPQGFAAPATIVGDMLLMKSGGLAALDRKTGKELWRVSSKSGTGCCTPVVSGNYAYFGSGCPNPNDSESVGAWSLVDAPRTRGIGWTLRAVDLRTGKDTWEFGTGDNVCGEPAIAYGRLYANSRDGRVYCFAPAKDGEPTVPEAKDKSPNASADEVKKCLSAPLDPPRPGKDWPMQGGTPERGGIEGVALNPPLAPAWKFDAGGRVLTAPAIRGGRVYFGSDSGKIFALDAAGGARVWEFQTGDKVRCSPAVAGGMAYCGSDDGSFCALDAASGAKKWAFQCGGPVQASPAVVGGAVVFGANDHNTYALDRLTGKKLWSFRSSYFNHQAPPVAHGDQVFLAPWVDWVYAVDAATGKELWKSYVPITIEALAFHKDKLYARTPYYVMEYDPATGKRLRMGDATCGWGGMGFTGDRLLQSGIHGQYGTGGATTLDLAGPGKPMKTKIPTLEDVLQIDGRGMKGGLEAMGAPLGLGDRVCIATVSGEVIVAGLDGKRQWSARLGGTCHAPPVAADGLLVVGCDDGHLYGFRGK